MELNGPQRKGEERKCGRKVKILKNGWKTGAWEDASVEKCLGGGISGREVESLIVNYWQCCAVLSD